MECIYFCHSMKRLLIAYSITEYKGKAQTLIAFGINKLSYEHTVVYVHHC